MAWDQRYRMLREGEVIQPTDEVEVHYPYLWQAPNQRTIGRPAPSPLYTSHRRYRRLRAPDDRVYEALREAERFMAYFAGETDWVFVGPGTPKSCLALIRSALMEDTDDE